MLNKSDLCTLKGRYVCIKVQFFSIVKVQISSGPFLFFRHAVIMLNKSIKSKYH